jgi:hypothetical protein
MGEVFACSCVCAVDCCRGEVFVAEGCEGAGCGWADGVED